VTTRGARVCSVCSGCLLGLAFAVPHRAQASSGRFVTMTGRHGRPLAQGRPFGGGCRRSSSKGRGRRGLARPPVDVLQEGLDRGPTTSARRAGREEQVRQGAGGQQGRRSRDRPRYESSVGPIAGGRPGQNSRPAGNAPRPRRGLVGDLGRGPSDRPPPVATGGPIKALSNVAGRLAAAGPKAWTASISENQPPGWRSRPEINPAKGGGGKAGPDPTRTIHGLLPTRPQRIGEGVRAGSSRTIASQTNLLALKRHDRGWRGAAGEGGQRALPWWRARSSSLATQTGKRQPRRSRARSRRSKGANAGSAGRGDQGHIDGTIRPDQRDPRPAHRLPPVEDARRRRPGAQLPATHSVRRRKAPRTLSRKTSPPSNAGRPAKGPARRGPSAKSSPPPASSVGQEENPAERGRPVPREGSARRKSCRGNGPQGIGGDSSRLSLRAPPHRAMGSPLASASGEDGTDLDSHAGPRPRR